MTALVHGSGRSEGSRAVDTIGDAAALPAEVATSWKPQEFQDKVLACVSGITFAVGGVGSGKSEACALRLLMWALEKPRRADGTPTEWFVIGPEFALIRSQQFSKILNHAKRLEGLGYGSVIRRVVTGLDPRIVLRDGQILLGRSGDHYERMEGPEVDGAWQDEAQRQPEEAFQTVVQRCRSSDGIRVAVSASPEDSPGWLWRVISGDESYSPMRKALLPVGGLRVFRWTSRANKANRGQVLDVIDAVLSAKSKAKSDQKLRGVFPGTHEAPSTSATNWVRAFVGSVDLPEADCRPHSLGLDIGETVDFSWLTIASSRGVVLAQERFNAGSPGVARSLFWDHLEDRAVSLAKTWRVSVVVVDAAKAGKPVSASLAKKLPGVRVEGYPTDAPGKKAALVEALLVECAKGGWRIPTEWSTSGRPSMKVDEVGQVRKELEDMIVRETGGRRYFDHAPGGHDDGIVSNALARHGLVSAPPAVATGTWSQPTLGKPGPAAGGWRQPTL